MGRWSIRTPVALAMALAMAAMGDDRHFADASDPVRVAWVSHLHDDGIDHRQVQAGWHSVVQEGGVLHPAIGVVEVFFIQSPADSLHHATLHLSFDIAGVDGFAGVLRS